MLRYVIIFSQYSMFIHLSSFPYWVNCNNKNEKTIFPTQQQVMSNQ